MAPRPNTANNDTAFFEIVLLTTESSCLAVGLTNRTAGRKNRRELYPVNIAKTNPTDTAEKERMDFRLARSVSCRPGCRRVTCLIATKLGGDRKHYLQICAHSSAG